MDELKLKQTEMEIKAYFIGLRMGLSMYSPKTVPTQRRSIDDELLAIAHAEKVALELAKRTDARR